MQRKSRIHLFLLVSDEAFQSFLTPFVVILSIIYELIHFDKLT